MASHSHIDDDDDFGGDYPGSHSSRRTGSKRGFGDLDDDDDDFFASKKGHADVQESVPGVTTGMILSLRESLQTCKDSLASCQAELEAAKSEIQKWHSAFQNEPTITHPEPALVVNYLQNLRSSEETLKEQLEKARKKEAAFIVTFAKREQEIAELKTRRLLLDPAIHEEFTRLKNLVEEKEKKVKELQDNVAAVNFTPLSKMGKMLMAKCRTLQDENEDIGKMASEGKIHDLSMKLSLQKSQNTDLRHQLQGVCEYMEELSESVEKSNELVSVLQQTLEEKDSELRRLREELAQRAARENGKDDSDDKKIAEDVNSENTE
ncbi:FKBP12-interacting protein of 37 kDa isoform X2 [Amborella trichopoda]|uniref:FKBP12-interacting protein of 37 kDa isoform X2 n=1 Tax=Amborella trichopoda TaxID=13333 RepID=UPI0005D34851|nr:FKBP12-interacting protein of 37 kDa isoform X2 [Amborella trichopoda]|eukprot:XP_011622076.1 FKBP12-interacting protein of 37 kDa isoform X2 [Amborella trichopoda]